MCGDTSFKNHNLLARHIDAHFNAESSSSDGDRLLAMEIQQREREEMKQREQREFDQLRAQYGMSENGNYRSQTIRGMEKDVQRGRLSITDFHERQVQECLKSFVNTVFYSFISLSV